MSSFASEVSASRLVDVRRVEVPIYLQSGEFYRSLCQNDGNNNDEVIQVPGNTLKADLLISNEQDVLHLLSSLRFWGVSDIPDELIAFCLSTEAGRCQFALQEFAADLPYMHTLTQVIDAKWKDNVEIITKSGNLALLDYLLRSGCFIKNANTFAVLADLPHVLRYLKDKNVPQLQWLFPLAINSNSIQCVKYFHEQGWPWPFDATELALTWGRLEILQYAYEHGATWVVEDFDTTFIQAIYNGHLQCIKFAYEHGCPGCSNAMCEAARVGNLEILIYLRSVGFAWDAQVSSIAAGSGHMECLQYLHEAGCPWDELTCKRAATTEILSYAHEHGCPWSVEVTMAAVGPGGLSRLAYLVEHDCPVSADVCETAALVGDLAALMYLHEHNCPWDENTCIAAARSGNLDCLKYAHDHGCAVGTVTLDAANAKHYNQPCIDYVTSVLGESS